MANINNNPQHRANLGYSGFAMDKLHKFSSTVGELRPVYYDFLSPGDKVSLSSILKTRTMEIDSAAMCSLTEHVDWFFVPMTRLYKLFPEFYFGVNDNQSSFVVVSQFKSPYPTYKFNQIPLEDEDSTYFNMQINVGAARLMEDFGLPLKQACQFLSDGNFGFNMSLNPILLQAYQCIYQDKFRLSNWETVDISYNVDKFYNTSALDNASVTNLFKLRYASYHKDFFTDIEPSPLFGNGNESSLSSVDYGAVNQWLTSTMSTELLDPAQVDASSNGSQASVAAMDNSQGALAALNTANIRTIFAVEKLLEITRRAGKHYDKQTLAHFGVDVPMGMDGECIYIGGSQSKINIGDVIATSAESLGKVGGKGYGFGQSGTEKFEAKCHGVLMAIYHCAPDVDYEIQGLDRLNTYQNRVDFFQPEFDDLGMQPIFNYQAQLLSDASKNALMRGWQYRYKELKQKFNTVSGALAGSLDYWTPSIIPYSDSVTGNASGVSINDLLITPYFLDKIMAVEYSPVFDFENQDPEAMYNALWNTDPLIHELYLDVKKASKMSTYGLPNL